MARRCPFFLHNIQKRTVSPGCSPSFSRHSAGCQFMAHPVPVHLFVSTVLADFILDAHQFRDSAFDHQFFRIAFNSAVDKEDDGADQQETKQVHTKDQQQARTFEKNTAHKTNDPQNDRQRSSMPPMSLSYCYYLLFLQQL